MGPVTIKWNTPQQQEEMLRQQKNEAILYLQKLVPWWLC